MANWAYINYNIVGEEEQLQSLYETMKELQDMPEPLIKNGFGTTWLGNLVARLGKDPEVVGCRGSWSGLGYLDDVLSFDCEAAWYRCTEVEELIQEVYPNLQIYFMCVESGMGIFEKNDSEGEYFPYDYLIDIEDDGEDYYTEDTALDQLSEFFCDNFKSMDDARVSVNKHNEIVDKEGGDNHIWIRDIVLVD